MIRQFRVLKRHWTLSAVAVFSLSIAMALGILSLSITNTFFILAPAGADPDRLVMIHTRSPGEEIGQVSYPDYKYYRENNHVFTDIAAAPNSVGANRGGEDINGECSPDLVCHFETQSTGFQSGDTLAILMGKTIQGVALVGQQAIVTVP